MIWTHRWRRAASVLRLLPWFVAMSVLKRFVPVPVLVRWSWRPPGRDATPALADSSRIAGTVLRTGTIAGIPDHDCLQRSLLLYRELSAAGLDPELAMGFQRRDGRLSGHAWVSVNGAVVAEPELNPSAFAPVVRYGAGGVRVGVD